MIMTVTITITITVLLLAIVKEGTSEVLEINGNRLAARCQNRESASHISAKMVPNLLPLRTRKFLLGRRTNKPRSIEREMTVLCRSPVPLFYCSLYYSVSLRLCRFFRNCCSCASVSIFRRHANRW